MKFFTAVFSDRYIPAGLGLVRSFAKYMPETCLKVFTDNPNSFVGAEEVSFETLYRPFGKFYESGERRNIFKLTLFQEMQKRYPDETLCWIDSDSLVLGNLNTYLIDDKINVLAHGRKYNIVNCGSGLRVDGAKYAIGGMYTIPPGPYLKYITDVAVQRPSWDGHPSQSGDQILLNHLVSKYPKQVIWTTNNKACLFNLAVADAKHPLVNDKRLAEIYYQNSGFWLEDRRIMLFYWIMNDFEKHYKGGFISFSPTVRKMLEEFYANI